jgi:hypothetical protein
MCLFLERRIPIVSNSYQIYFREEGVDFWGLTAQNEPMDGNIPDFSFNCMGWNATTQVYS